MRASVRSSVVALGCVAAAVCLGACGSAGSSSDNASGRMVTVYSSLPEQGASKDTIKSIENSINLAFSQSHWRAGGMRIKYVPLDDSTAQAGGWDPEQTAANARKVIKDKSAIVYLAEYNSGAAAISIPITNQAGLTQLSATNSYVGLTTNDPGSQPGEPAKYYPTGVHTFFRVAPRDSIEAAADVALMKRDGCQRVGAANDNDTYGAGLARGVAVEARRQGLNVVSNEAIQKDAPNFRAYGASLRNDKVDCFYFSGVTANGAVQLTKDVGTALPNARIYGSDGICETAYLDAGQGGLPASIAKRVKCTVATLDLAHYPGGERYLKAYRAQYHSYPGLWAIYWYEAARLTADTIAAGGTDRTSFREKLAATKNRNSVLGRYSFTSTGDSDLTTFAVYTSGGTNGDPKFIGTVKAAKS